MGIKSYVRHLFTLGRHEAYETGIALYNQGRYEQALERLAECAHTRQDRGSLHGNLAAFYSGLALRNMGILSLYSGDYQEAVEHFTRSATFNPNHFGVYNYLGVCYNNLGQYDLAMEAFQKAIRINPGMSSVRLKLAIVFHNLQMHDRAISTLKDTLRQHPNWADMRYHLGLMMASKGDLQGGIDELTEALKSNPMYVNARIKLGVLLGVSARFDEAVEHLEFVLERYPTYADVHYHHGLFLASLKKLERAENAFRRAIELSPNYTDALIKLGIVLGHQGRADEALATFETALASKPTDIDADFLVTYINKLQDSSQAETSTEQFARLLSGFYTQAAAQITNRIQITPDFSEIIHLFSPKTDAALYETFIKLYSDAVRKQPRFADLRNHLGQFLYRTGQLDEAAEHFAAALDINPDFVKARINYIKTLRDQKKTDQAEQQINRLLEQGVRYPDLLLELGRIQRRKKHYNRALAAIEDALEINPEYAPGYLEKANVLEKMRLFDDAITSLERAAILDPETLPPDELEARLELIRQQEAPEPR
jgi:tetratricopeptide (TPR) repeat protein